MARDEMDWRVERRRGDSDPRCAGCKWWSGGRQSRARCEYHGTDVLDMALCGAFARAGQAQVEIMQGAESDEA